MNHKIYDNMSLQLTGALDAAIARYTKLMGEPFSGTTSLEVIESNAFSALALPTNDGVALRISSGVAASIEDLWHKAMAVSVSLPHAQQLNFDEVGQAIDHSLLWLMLHELHHFENGHLDLIGPAGLAETSMGLTSRGNLKENALAVSAEETLLLRRCMEMQADHEATEMLLDAYSSDGWGELRFLAACTFAVMILIDQEDSLPDDQRTHPKAATRIFQLLGYVSTMWSIPAMLKAQREGLTTPRPSDLPTADEISQFQSKVVAPAFADAVLIASAAGADHIVSDLGDPTELMRDVGVVLHDPETEPLTAAGQEYRLLTPYNAKLQEMLTRR